MYRWAEHTSELELRIEAASEPEVFCEAQRALAELLADEARDGDRQPKREDGSGEEGAKARAGEQAVAAEPLSVELTVRADDRETLLASWLEELLYLADTERRIPAAVQRLELDGEGERLEARIECSAEAPRPFVKAVTYHRLSLDRAGDGRWRATVVLDV